MRRILPLTFVALVIALQPGCQSLPAKPGFTTSAQSVDPVAELHAKLGSGYLREGKLELAWHRLNKALTIEPKYSIAHNTMALLYERLGQAEKAREHYQLAVSYNPADSSAQTNYGSFLCRQGEYVAAEQQFQKAMEDPLYRKPEIPYANLGLCLQRSGQFALEENYLRQALELNPRIPGALIAMSDLSLHNGQELSARAYMQRYVEVRSHSPRTLWLGVRIERALGDLDAAASYAMLLKSNYPDSQETRLLLESNLSGNKSVK